MIFAAGEALWDCSTEGETIGGAPLNFAFHCRQLGRAATIISRIGTDDRGRRLLAGLQSYGLHLEQIQTDLTRPTGHVLVHAEESKSGSMYTIFPDVAWDGIECSPALEEIVETGRAFVFGTLALRAEPSRSSILKLADANSRSVLPSVRICDVNLRDPRPLPTTIRAAVEMAEWVKVTADELPEVADACGVALEDLPTWHAETHAGAESVWIVTDGGNGAKVITTNESYSVSAAPAKIVDTVGAGDSFGAALLCRWLETENWPAALHFAAWYAARVCEHVGATPIIDWARYSPEGT
jgi:fructokinase